MIGPFSLAGRLMGVSDALANCYDEPDMVHITMKKATEFLTSYILAYKQNTGAAGVVMAEPLTGLLSPGLAEEFSEPYVREIVEAVQDDNFLVIYHNCGDNTIPMIDSILRTGAAAYHFGNSISMADILTHIPSGVVAMGNVDPASQFRNGTPASIGRKATPDYGGMLPIPELRHFLRLRHSPGKQLGKHRRFLRGGGRNSTAKPERPRISRYRPWNFPSTGGIGCFL